MCSSEEQTDAVIDELVNTVEHLAAGYFPQEMIENKNRVKSERILDFHSGDSSHGEKDDFK